jgi:hypothetical protein
MNHILLQTVYILRRPSWWIAAFLSLAAMMQGMIGEGLSKGMNLAYLIVMAMNFGVFIPLAPLAAVFAVCGHLQSAIHKSCCYPHLLRSGKRRFVIEIAISSALAGGLALLLGWSLAIIMARIIGASPLVGDNMLGLERTAMGTLLTGNSAWLYYLFRAFVVFLYGCFCVFCAIPIAMYRLDATIISLVPFIVMRIGQFFLFNSLPVFLSPTRILLGNSLDSLDVMGGFLMNLLGLFILSCIMLVSATHLFNRRLRLD